MASKDDDNRMCPPEITLDYVKKVIEQVSVLRKNLDALCDCFLVRAKDVDPDPLWKRFYSIQMCQYLIAKKDLEVSEPEGDMVHDLIRDTWDEVKDYMENSKFGPISNVEQWFKTIKVDFPLDPFDPDCVFFDENIYCLCQKDTKTRQKEETV